ncbi:MAG: integrase arm-type DNA-binding domain-containing protein [Mesorhizobium sp.]|nr:integrase arm-type DNA-binding domain-containing protein [Mesorhizobium sp.]
MAGKVLTQLGVKSALPDPTKRREIGDGALPGLYLVVQPSGKKSWALRYRRGGVPKKLTLGTVLLERSEPATGEPALGMAMTLVEARAAARAALQFIAEGKDPVEVKKAEKAAAAEAADPNAAKKDHVRTHAAEFIERYCKPRNRSWREVERQFKADILPSWGDRSVKEITKRDVIELLDRIVDRGSPVSANRVFATLRKFFGRLEDRDVIPNSPCTGVKPPSAEISRDRVLTDEEIKLFWKATATLGQPFGPMFRLLLITGQRREEVAGMMRKELHLTGAAPSWQIPRERAKNDTAHEVPMSQLAIETINSIHTIGKKGFVFTTTGDGSVSGYSRAKDRLDLAMLKIARKEAEDRGKDPKKIETAPRWTLHDLRRTMASRMAGLDINLPVVEKILNHTSGSFAGIVGVYQRHDFNDQKRRALNAWADYLIALTSEVPDNVVMLRGGAR